MKSNSSKPFHLSCYPLLLRHPSLLLLFSAALQKGEEEEIYSCHSSEHDKEEDLDLEDGDL